MFTSRKPSPLRDDVRAGTAAPVALVNQLKAAGIDGPIPRELLKLDRNRWMMFSFGLLILCIVLVIMFANAAADARSNTKLMYVKMYSNGTWDTDFFDSTREADFLPITVDSILGTWVQRRFQENPATVGKDYGFARLFMDAKTAGAFVDPAQGNAVKRAAEIRDNHNGPFKEIDIRTINHFDSEKATFGRQAGSLYRTNIFIQENLVQPTGQMAGSRLFIVKLQWRLMSKKEIQARAGQKDGPEWLRANPIGVQILGYDYLEDPSEVSKPSTPPST